MISITTPSIRPEALEIVAKCLKRQTFMDWEWLIGSPSNLFISLDRQIGHDIGFEFIPEPPRKEGDYYSLNKCWNSLFKRAQGELIVNIVDGIWFEPDLLERLWQHYQANPKIVISCIGHQYDRIENDKPEHMVWRDPRVRTDFGSFYEVSPWEIEFCVASLSRQAIVDVGGIDEKFDKYAALSEKEMGWRIDKLGYKFYLDQGIEYRAIHHPRLNKEWDERFNKGFVYYNQCIKEIAEGKRLKLAYL